MLSSLLAITSAFSKTLCSSGSSLLAAKLQQEMESEGSADDSAKDSTAESAPETQTSN